MINYKNIYVAEETQKYKFLLADCVKDTIRTLDKYIYVLENHSPYFNFFQYETYENEIEFVETGGLYNLLKYLDVSRNEFVELAKYKIKLIKKLRKGNKVIKKFKKLSIKNKVSKIIGKYNTKSKIIDGKKKCSKCSEIKELKFFYVDKRLKDGYRSSCIECKKVLN